MAKVEKTRWYKLIHKCIKTARRVERSLLHLTADGYAAKNVLIYCQTGSGPSAVISSLSQLMLDPYYRTYEGFRALVTKEWVYFGHNFMKSCNLNNDIPSLAEQVYAPYFVLFLDCVHQLLTMNRTEFEFTEELLAYLGYHTFTCKYYELTHLNSMQYLVGTQMVKGVA